MPPRAFKARAVSRASAANSGVESDDPITCRWSAPSSTARDAAPRSGAPQALWRMLNTKSRLPSAR